MAAFSQSGRLNREFQQRSRSINGRILTPYRFAKMVYDKESKPIIQRLWDETMMEFEFAHASQILASL
jgi:hypothetical protein